MSVSLWCAGVEHRDNGQRWRWRSLGSCQWTRSGEGRALGLDSRRVTSRGGWHLGHALAQGRGGASRVIRAVPGLARHMLGNTHAVWYSRGFSGWSSKKHLMLRTAGFRSSLASKLDGGSSSRNWWWHMVSQRRVRQGEATSWGARGYWIKNPEVGPFSPGEVDRLYVNRGSLV
jgi:hypothetical protein